MLKVLSDVLLAADNQKVTLLALLDLSAAFNCVDHDILLYSLWLDYCNALLAGITDTQIKRLQSVQILQLV